MAANVCKGKLKVTTRCNRVDYTYAYLWYAAPFQHKQDSILHNPTTAVVYVGCEVHAGLQKYSMAGSRRPGSPPFTQTHKTVCSRSEMRVRANQEHARRNYIVPYMHEDLDLHIYIMKLGVYSNSHQTVEHPACRRQTCCPSQLAGRGEC